MESDSLLPSFVQPPLDEVAADLQFNPLAIKAADVGAFHALIAGEYPHSMDVPPLPPTFETEGGSSMSPFGQNIAAGFLPRSWFISLNDEHLIQLQTDRLIVNWRSRPNGNAYPLYQEVRKRFAAAHEALTVFVNQRGYSDVVPNQCDLSYFNKVPLPPGVEWGDVDQLLRGVTINSFLTETEQFSDCHLLLRRSIRNQEGNTFRRLQVECRPIQTGVDQKAWGLNITVKGRPAHPTLEAVLDFFDTAHVEIVRCFSAITTETMQSLWGKRT